jgi:hypothetical protein
VAYLFLVRWTDELQEESCGSDCHVSRVQHAFGLFGIWWFRPDGQQRIANPTQFERSVFLISGQVFGFVSLMQYPLAYLASLSFRQLGFPYRTILFVFLNSVLSGLFYAWVVGLLVRLWRRFSI